MKRILSLLLGIILCFSFMLISCSSNEESVSDNKIFEGTHSVKYSETSEYLVKDGKSDYKIVVSSNPDNKIQIASNELQDLFFEATGIRLPIVNDNLEYSKDNKVICLGKNNYYQKALSSNEALSTENCELEHDGYKINTVGNGIFIYGNYSDGAIFGVYGLLEIEFSFECFSNTGYIIDKNVNEVTLKNYDVVEVPDFMFRSCYYTHITNNGNTKYRMLFGEGNSFSVRYGKDDGAHNTELYVPFKEYNDPQKADKYHPDWFSGDGTQLCYYANGNEKEYEALINTVFEVMKQDFIDNPNGYFFRLGQADTTTWCNCSACAASIQKYNANSAGVVFFANDLAEKMDAWLLSAEGKPYFRDYRIMFLSYGLSLSAPTRYNEQTKTYEGIDGIKCHDKVMPWFAPIELNYTQKIDNDINKTFYDAFMGWDAISNEMSFYTYSTNFHNYLVPLNFFDQLQLFYQYGAKSNGYFICDLGQRGQSSAVTGFQTLMSYLISKLSWDVNTDIAAATKNFFDGYFGPAAQSMMSYYNSFRVQSKLCADKYYTLSHATYMRLLDRNYWPKDLLETWLGNIDQAFKDIEYLKKVDLKLYNEYYRHIAVERIGVYYLVIELYSTSFNADFIEQIKMQFKNDCNTYGIVLYGEGDRTISSLCQTWGI